MIRIDVHEKRWVWVVFWTALTIEIVIVLMDIFLNYYQWIPSRTLRRSFNITREDGVGNWFSSTQALATAIVLGLIYLSSKPRRIGWAFVALFFGYMAFDDATRFHERVGSAFEDWFGKEELLAYFPSYAWQVVLVPLFALAGICIWFFLWCELRTTGRLWILSGGFGLFALAIGLDFLEGLDLALWKSYTNRHFQKLIEEFFEMLGMTMFLTAFLGHLLHGKTKVEIT